MGYDPAFTLIYGYSRTLARRRAVDERVGCYEAGGSIS